MSSPEDYTFVPPTNPEGEIENYDFLRPKPEQITAGDAPFRGMNPFELMELMGGELTAESGVTKWSITYDIQQACGVVLRDKDMKVMIGWADEEIKRQKILKQDLPPDQLKRELQQTLFGIEIDNLEEAPRKKKA